jgi:hypothetical protein
VGQRVKPNFAQKDDTASSMRFSGARFAMAMPMLRTDHHITILNRFCTPYRCCCAERGLCSAIRTAPRSPTRRALSAKRPPRRRRAQPVFSPLSDIFSGALSRGISTHEACQVNCAPGEYRRASTLPCHGVSTRSSTYSVNIKYTPQRGTSLPHTGPRRVHVAAGLPDR